MVSIGEFANNPFSRAFFTEAGSRYHLNRQRGLREGRAGSGHCRRCRRAMRGGDACRISSAVATGKPALVPANSVVITEIGAGNSLVLTVRLR
jgi:hypothetical protein